MAELHATPRRLHRVQVLGNVAGEVSFLHEVSLLDLSEGALAWSTLGGLPSTPSATLAYRLPRGIWS